MASIVNTNQIGQSDTDLIDQLIKKQQKNSQLEARLAAEKSKWLNEKKKKISVSLQLEQEHRIS